MNLERIAELAESLRKEADSSRASFGLYREAYEEDAFARATRDGVVLFAVELLNGLGRVDNPVGNSIIELDKDTLYEDPQADLNLHAIEIYGDDLLPPRKRRLRIARKEYAAIMGCMVSLIVVTLLSLAGLFYLGSLLWGWVLPWS
jgi:hypothetical protein